MSQILLSHGGGGTFTKELIENVVVSAFRNETLETLDDAACVHVAGEDLVFTTDSYVVDPLFFPGGDIGKLAVCGTANDLAMQGGEPKWMSLSLILEEGLEIATLRRIVESAAQVLNELGITVVTGDTKVVERGRGSGVFINTAGIGIQKPGVDVGVWNAKPGDRVIVTGTIGDHGIAVMSQREGLGFEMELQSDVAALWPMISQVLEKVPTVHCLRDPTRGGLAGALNDIAERSAAGIRICERALPVRKEVRGACDLLGFDPLNVANEGKALVVCSDKDAQEVLEILRAHPLGREAAIIGEVTDEPKGMVLLETIIGGERIVETPSGEDLPRIC